MCGRRLEELVEHFPIDVANIEAKPNYNVAPTQQILAIARHDEQNTLRYHLERMAACPE